MNLLKHWQQRFCQAFGQCGNASFAAGEADYEPAASPVWAKM